MAGPRPHTTWPRRLTTAASGTEAECSRHAVVTGTTNDVRAAEALSTEQGTLSAQGTLGVALTCW